MSTPSLATGEFLSEMSLLMGLPQGGAAALQDSAAFWGPGGLLCRLQLQQDSSVTAVRPQVLLPMLARELGGWRVEQMMAMQQAVFLEYGWMLGLSSEGMLQLSPMKWIEQPSDAVAALDLGHAVGMQALETLFVEADDESPDADEDEDDDDGADFADFADLGFGSGFGGGFGNGTKNKRRPTLQ